MYARSIPSHTVVLISIIAAFAWFLTSVAPAAAQWSGTVTIEHTYSTSSAAGSTSHRQTVTYTLTGVTLPGGAAGPLRFDEVATWSNNYSHSESGGTCPDGISLFTSSATSQDAGTGNAVIQFFQRPDGSWVYDLAAAPAVSQQPLDRLLRCGELQASEPYPVMGVEITWGTGELAPLPPGETPATVTTLSGSSTIEGVTFCCDRATITWSLTRGLSPTADLQVQKRVRTLTPTSGASITYDLVVTNLGPDIAFNVSLADSPGAGLGDLLSLTSTQTGVTCAISTRTCSTESLVPGNSFTATAVFATEAGVLMAVNDAAVSTSTVDPVQGNNSATVNTPLQAPAALLPFVIAVQTGYSLPFSVTSPGLVKGGDAAQVIGEPETIAQVAKVCIQAADWEFVVAGARSSAALTYGGDPSGADQPPTSPIGYHALPSECGRKTTIAGVEVCTLSTQVTYPLVLAEPFCTQRSQTQLVAETHLVTEFPVTILFARLVTISHEVTAQVVMQDGRIFECTLSKQTGGTRPFLGGTKECTITP